MWVFSKTFCVSVVIDDGNDKEIGQEGEKCYSYSDQAVYAERYFSKSTIIHDVKQ